MDAEKFAKVKAMFEARERLLLGSKRKQYAVEDDVLRNFRVNGALLGLRPEQVAIVLMSKHFQSVAQQVMAGNFEWEWEGKSGEGLKQHLSDLRNYAILVAACIEERLGVEVSDGPGCDSSVDGTHRGAWGTGRSEGGVPR